MNENLFASFIASVPEAYPPQVLISISPLLITPNISAYINNDYFTQQLIKLTSKQKWPLCSFY